MSYRNYTDAVNAYLADTYALDAYDAACLDDATNDAIEAQLASPLIASPSMFNDSRTDRLLDLWLDLGDDEL